MSGDGSKDRRTFAAPPLSGWAQGGGLTAVLQNEIGVTGGSVTSRINGAKLNPTFLLADVEVVATYKLSNINRTKLKL